MKITLEREKKATKYCAKCGNLINGNSKKCTGCGKQYFRFPKITVWKCIVIVAIVGLVGLNYYQYQTNLKADKLLQSYMDRNVDLINRNDKLSTKSSLQGIELTFWNNHAVIVTEAGEKYHHYGCPHLDGSTSFWIYNVEAAKLRGYEPCLDCFSSGGLLSDYIEKYN